MVEKMKIAISSDFLTAFAQLPRQVQGKVTEFVNKFRNDPTAPGINYEKIGQAIDKKIYSARVDDNYRCIVVRQPESGTYLLLWVDHHDEAYQWAARKRCEVNPHTGAIQLFDVLTVVEAASSVAQASLFSKASDEDLLKLGLPEEQISFVRAMTDKEQFYSADNALPRDAYEYLSWLVEGFEVSEVLKMAEDDLTAANLMTGESNPYRFILANFHLYFLKMLENTLSIPFAFFIV